MALAACGSLAFQRTRLLLLASLCSCLPLLVVLLQVLDLEVHYDLYAASNILEDLETIAACDQPVLLVLKILIIDLVELLRRSYLDGQV